MQKLLKDKSKPAGQMVEVAGTSIEESVLEASVCLESFFDFVKSHWSIIIPEVPVWNWHIEYLCNELQKIAEQVFCGKPKKEDVVINIPPGTTKSTIVSVMFPAWVWTRMPSARFICGSYAFSLAMELARRSRDVITSKKYQQLFPGITIRDDQNTKELYINTQNGARRSIGSGGAIIGFHAHFILIDDPIDPQAAVSEAEMREVNRWINETLSQRKVDKKVSVTVLIMQRLHQNDPSADKLSKGGARHICLPDRVSKYVSPPELKSRYRKGLLDPVRLSEVVLANALIELGQYGYAGQFSQHPVPAGGGMFKTDKLIRGMTPPRRFKKLVRYWDKAATEAGGAFTVGTLMGEDREGLIWVLDVIRDQWSSGYREKVILRTAKSDGVLVVVGIEQEPGSGGKESAENTVKMLRGFRAKINRPHGDKVMRADPFSVQVNIGNVALKEGHWNKVFIDELTFFPYSKYKDQVDSASGAFTLLTQAKLRVGALQ